jgi:single-strand DNA-binding protein
VVWDRQAETCNQYLRKGSPVFVEGRLQSRSFEDASGQKRNVIEVRAERVQFLRTQSQKAQTDSFEETAGPATSTEDNWLEESEGVANET